MDLSPLLVMPLSRSLAKTRVNDGLQIRNPVLTVVDGSTRTTVQWYESILSKMSEFTILWTESMESERQQGFGLNKLQN